MTEQEFWDRAFLACAALPGTTPEGCREFADRSVAQRQEVEAQGQVHAFRLLDERMALPPVPVAGQLGWASGAAKLYLETLHLADGKPFAFETRWLNSEILPRPMPDFQSLSANEWLVAHVAYVTGDIAFTAEGAGARDVAVLGVPAHGP